MTSPEFTPPERSDEPEASRWTGRVEFNLRNPEEPTVVVSPPGVVCRLWSPGEDAEAGGLDPDAPRRWLLAAPALLAVVYVGLVWAFGAALLDTGRPGIAGGIATLLLIVFFLVALAGTLVLYRDAERVAAAGGAWRPNPWWYLLGGSLPIVVFRLSQVSVAGLSTRDLAGYLLGNLLVAVLLASVVAGPVYLVRRSRRAG